MLSDEKIDAIILAESGLRRLDMYDSSFCHRIDVDRFIPAVGQGVITAEVRSLDQDLIKILSSASDNSIEAVISIEREFINTLNADCDSPVGAYITQNSDKSYFGQFMYSPTISESLKFMEKFIDINKKNLGAELAMEILASN